MDHTTDGSSLSSPSQRPAPSFVPRVRPSLDAPWVAHPDRPEFRAAPMNSPTSDATAGANNGDRHNGLGNEHSESVAPPSADLASLAGADPFCTDEREPHVKQMVDWLRLFVAKNHVVELAAPWR